MKWLKCIATIGLATIVLVVAEGAAQATIIGDTVTLGDVTLTGGQLGSGHSATAFAVTGGLGPEFSDATFVCETGGPRWFGMNVDVENGSISFTFSGDNIRYFGYPKPVRTIGFTLLSLDDTAGDLTSVTPNPANPLFMSGTGSFDLASFTADSVSFLITSDGIGNINSSGGGTYVFNYEAGSPELTAIPPGGSTLDFGGVAQGGTATLYSAVSLQNTGGVGSTIDLQGAVLSGPGAAYFGIVLGDPTLDLAGGGPPEVFDLQFDATGLAPDLYLADITFQNDSPQGNVTYQLSANVLPAAEPAGLGLIGLVMLAVRKRRS